MTDNLRRLDFSFLESHGDYLANRLVGSSVRNNFQLSEELGAFADQLVILDGNLATLNSPQILFGGSDTLASNEFEIEWPHEIIRPQQMFSQSYIDLTSNGYRDCILEQQVVIEHIECSNAVIDGVLPINYKRALIPVTNGLGAWFIACYAFDSTRVRYPRVSELSATRLRAGIQRSTNLHMPC